MRGEENGLALTGFVLSLCSAGLYAAGLLCLMGVMLSRLLSFAFGGMAGAMAVTAVVLSGIGNYRSHGDGIRGAGFSVAGLIIGTMVITLVLSAVAMLVVAAVATP